jgi:hypothetical protein
VASKTNFRIVIVGSILMSVFPRILPAQRPSGDRDLATDVVQQALLAQVRGWGGCRTLDVIAPYESAYFRSVELHEGHCEAGHGAIRRAVVGLDRDGVVYLLDSPSAFSFLILRHPPLVPSDSTVLWYVSEALTMMGEIPWGARLVTTSADLPLESRRALAASVSLKPSILQQSSAATHLSLVYASQVDVRRLNVTVSPSGHAAVFRREVLWSESMMGADSSEHGSSHLP